MTNCVLCTKTNIIAIFVIVLFLFSGVALGQVSNEESEVYRIARVDHKNNQLLINDKIYQMPISLKTYIFESKTRKKYKVNRYALKVGQVVSFNVEIKNRQAYINKITIFRG